MTINFIDSLINVSEKEVLTKLKPYKKLNYNPYYWWRTHSLGNTPLSKKENLLYRIRNGDFDLPSYWWQSQLALINAKKKIEGIDDYNIAHERISVDIERYRKLIIDFNKEETERIENLKSAFISTFNIDEETLLIELEKWPYGLEKFFYHIQQKIKNPKIQVFIEKDYYGEWY